MSFTWANELAKTALKNAQKKIDAVLDIHEGEEDGNEAEGTLVIDSGEPSSLILDQPTFISSQPHKVEPEVLSEAAASDHWRSALTDGREPEVIVDQEPNPIRDEIPHSTSSLLNHSPASNSPDEAETEECRKDSNTLSSPDTESVAVIGHSEVEEEMHEVDITSHSRRSSRHEDSLTVASSDIEVIRNVDTWSLASSHQRPAQQNMSQSVMLPAPKVAENVNTLLGQLRHHEQRIDELTKSNKSLNELNTQLQQRIVALNQQQTTMKKDIATKEKELQDLLDEGKRLSDHSGKQSREIRRLKAQVADVDKIKAERKKFKEEKQDAENTIDILKEEMDKLKESIKKYDHHLQEAKSDRSANIIASEVYKSQQEENNRKIVDLEEELTQARETINILEREKDAMENQLSSAEASQLAGKIAGERANETAIIASKEVNELKRQNEYMRTQVADLQRKLDDAIFEKSLAADAISKSNAPLLSEIQELKSQLLSEQTIADEKDIELRRVMGDLKSTKEQVNKANDVIRTLSDRHSEEQNHLILKLNKMESSVANQREQHELAMSRVESEKNLITQRLHKLEQKNDELSEENQTLRTTLKDLENVNKALKEQIFVLSTAKPSKSEEHDEKERSVEPIKVMPVRESPQVDRSPSPPLSSFASQFAFPSSAAQSELESVLNKYEQSMHRITELEALSRKLEEKLGQKDATAKEFKNKYKELTVQYNSLLEMDGERLEKIEELENDIIDLRQLLKEQLIAFAEAGVKGSSGTLPPGSAQ